MSRDSRNGGYTRASAKILREMVPRLRMADGYLEMIGKIRNAGASYIVLFCFSVDRNIIEVCLIAFCCPGSGSGVKAASIAMCNKDRISHTGWLHSRGQ